MLYSVLIQLYMLHIHACNDACMEYGYLSFFQQKNPFKFQNKSNYDMNDAEHFVTHRYNNLDKFESWNMDAYLNKRLY